MTSVLVTGATGVIGPNLVSRLVAEGYRVRVLARSSMPEGLLPDSVEVVRGDIADRAAVSRAVEGASIVFHLAAKLHINNPSPGLLGEYRRVNVEGTRVLTELAQETGVKRLVFFSSIAVYGRSARGEVLDEDSPLAPTSIYGQTKLEAERIALAAQRRDGVPLAVVLRLAGVYGPRIKGDYRRLVIAMRQGWFLPVGSGTNRRTLIHERDVAEAALLAAEHPDAAGRIFNLTDGSIHSFAQIVEAICKNLGRRPPRYCIALGPVLAAARIVDAGFRVGGRGGKAVPMVTKLVEDMAVSGDRIRDVLGFEPRVGLVAGWRTAIPAIMDATDITRTA